MKTNSLEALKPIVDNHEIVKHPFLKAFAEGRLSREQVVFWFTQQFYFSISLPKCFAALFARFPERYWQHTVKLSDLLHTEAWGSNVHDAHSVYFQEVAKHLNIDLERLTNQAPEKFTKKYIEQRLAVCIDSTIHVSQGLAAIALGNEHLNLHIFRSYRAGIHRVTGLADCPTGYFDAHLRDEAADFAVFQELFDLITAPEFTQQAEVTLKKLLDQRIEFFDALQLHVQRMT